MENKLEAIKEEFSKEKNVLLIYLFGSYSKKTQSKLSDIDIAILLSESDKNDIFNKKLEYFGKLTEIFKNNEIDLIILNEAPISLKFAIIKTGNLIFSRNEKERVRFEENIILEYLDIKPLFDYYNKYIFRRIDEGKFGVR